MRADDSRSEFWRLVTFSESSIAELMRLNAGDHIAVQGAMRAEIFTPGGGEPRISLSITGETITPLRGKPKQRADKVGQRSPQSYRRPAASQAANGPDREFRMRHHGGTSYDQDLNDDLSF